MAQIIDNGSNAMSGVKTEKTAGWLDALLRDGPRVMVALFGLGLGAGLLVRLFIGEFVSDYKLALVLTVGSCAVGLAVVAGVPFLIWIIRETSKASVAGVSMQMTEMAGLVRESINQTNAVTNTLVQVTGAYMTRAGAGSVNVQQLPAPGESYSVKKIAKADLVATGGGDMIARDKLLEMAKMIYDRMYLQGIPPTQANIRQICKVTSNGHIVKALDVLAEWGVCSGAQQGREREWLYKGGEENASQA